MAAVIVDDQGRVLALQRRDNSHWEPPGGVLELGETIHDGLLREVREETGLEVVPEALTGVYKNMRRGIVALVFRCAILGGELTTSNESRDLRWIHPDEAHSYMAEAYAVRITDALSDQSPQVRIHDGSRLLRQRTVGP
ncbi:MAG: NUDIX domain-containing protein [Actinomycetota bacterium]|nr:NUDIX domain-containing protein [Actinomycetota bacterium]